jgi:hypothetical protein
MLKREITYQDFFDGETVTETLYFNLTKTEILKLEASYDDGLQDTLMKMIRERDMKTILEEFERIVLLAYGRRAGNRFEKSDQIREEFKQTAAYDALFMELATDTNAQVAFVKGILPPEFAQAAEKAQAEDRFPPPPPAVTNTNDISVVSPDSLPEPTQ